MSEQKNHARLRNVATVIYPDSAPENWRDIIDSWHIPVFVSPLHDNDVNPDGSRKEPHYHVMAMNDGVWTETQWRNLFSQINGKGLEKVKNVRAYARYLLHLDHPSKAQYSRADLLSFAGADFDAVTSCVSDQLSGIRKAEKIVEDYDVSSLYELQAILDKVDPALSDFLRIGHCYYMSQYISSRYWFYHKADPEVVSASKALDYLEGE